MDRIIQVKVRGHYMTKDNNKAGVQGEVNATHLHIEFDPSWEGLAKSVIFYDAHGGNPTKIVLTADNIIQRNDIPGEGLYVTHDVPIPGEAMTEHGWAEFIVEGVKDGVVAKSLADKLYVHEAPNTDGAGNAVEPTPSDLAQLQLQLEGILDKLMDAIEVGEMLDGVLSLDELVKLAQSYAVGGSGARPGENTDNAKYYYELCRQIANGNTGTPDSGGDSLPDSGGSSGGASGVVGGITEYIVSCYINSDNELIFVTSAGNNLNAGKIPTPEVPVEDNDVFYVTFSGNDTDGWTADKTYAEITAAIEAGRVVQGLRAYSDATYVLHLIMKDGNLLIFRQENFNNKGHLQFTMYADDRIIKQARDDNGMPSVNTDDNGYRTLVVDGKWKAVASSPHSVDVVKSGNTVTVTATYKVDTDMLYDETVSTSVITLDANGDPVSVTTDGVTCALTWEGFDA